MKPKKAKGPIRLEAVVPAAIVFGLIGAYFTIFFDSHLRRGLEYVGTQVNGAEVNIGRLATSFLGARLEIDQIQVTDKNKPERNIVQVGQVRFQLLWDALLRAKVVVNEAQILNIQALNKRKKPGYVVPPTPPSQGPTLIDKAQDQVLSETRKKYNQNFLGDIANILGGTDPKEQLKNIQGELKSDARVKQLEAELKDKKAKWEKRISELPQAQELKAYEGRIKALKFNANNPVEFANSVKEADKIIKEVDQKVKLVEQTSKDIKGETNSYTQAFKDLEKMVNEDLRDLQKRLKIPSVDGKEFSQQLFMKMVEQKLMGVRKYVAVAREYMPPKKTAEEKQAKKDEQLVPRRRGEGKNYRFPITTGYPLFWLQKAAISSELGQSEYSGNIKGEIRDITTSPQFIKKPALILVQGDFPNQGIAGLDAKITLDHTTDQAKESMVVSVGSFPVGESSLSDSPDVKLAIRDAKGASVMNATLVDQTITMDLKNQFGSINYDLEAKNKMVKEILDNVLKDIPTVTLNASIKGSFDDFDLHINSNLGEELAKGFQRQLQAKIEEAKAELKKMIDGKIGAEKDRLKAEMDKTIGGLTKQLDGKKAEVDGAVKQAKSAVEGEKGKNSPAKKLEEEGKKLLKGFKFGG
ncbi:MAG: TIGR03545 family protein [Bdellovibrionales bacterium]